MAQQFTTRTESDDRKAERKDSTGLMEASLSSGLNLRQQAVLKMQQTQGNAAAQRMMNRPLNGGLHLAKPSRPVSRHTIQRAPEDGDPVNVANEMNKATNAADANTRKDANYAVAGAMSTVNDTGVAKKLVGEIDLNQPQVERGEASGLSDWKGSSGSNLNLKATLEEFISQNDIQNVGVSQFKQQFQRAQVDFNRMDASFQTFDAQNGAGLDKAKSPDEMMNKINKGAMLTDFDDKRMKEDIGGTSESGKTGAAHQIWQDARDKKTLLEEQQRDLAVQQGLTLTELHSVAAVQGEMNAGVLAAKADPDPDKQKKLAGVVAQNEAAKKAWGMVSAKVTEAASAGANAVAPGSGELAKKGMEQVPALIDAYYASALSLAQLASDNSKEFNQLTSVAAAQSKLSAAQGKQRAQFEKYANLMITIEQTKKDYQAAMEKLGVKLDTDLKTGNNAYAQIAKLSSEATTFVAQAKATIEIGKHEKDQASKTGIARDKMIDPKSGKAMPWFSVRAQSEVEKQAGVNGSSYGILVRNTVRFSDFNGSNKSGTGADVQQGGAGFGAGGANELIDKQIEQLEDVTKKAEGIKQKLDAKLGF